MPWWQLTLEADSPQCEALEALLLELGASAVTLDDAGDEPLFELAPGNMPRWSQIRLTGLFADEIALLAALAQLPEPLPAYQISTLADEPWERSWMARFQPIRCGERLWICPSWHQVDEPGAVVLQLDPGLAFGTGNHPTTQLCLGWLDSHPLAGLRVIDYGCGSGILGVAAALLGAAHVAAVDIDPQALTATQENARRNGVAERVQTGFPGTLTDSAELLLANILAGPLEQLAPHFRTVLAPGGYLVMAGLLARHVAPLQAAYADWIALQPVAERDGWVCLAGQRPRT